MGYTAQDLIKVAEAEIGYLEKETNSNLDSKTGNAGDNNWTKYARDLYTAGFFNGNKNGYAWCTSFVVYCHYVASGKNKTLTLNTTCQTGTLGAGCIYAAQYYRNAGRFYSSPKVGDQIFFGVKGDEYHTGIVYKVDSSRVYTIEGNTSGDAGVIDNGGGVFKKSYSRSYSGITGYGRPRFDGESNEVVEAPDDGCLYYGDSGAKVKELQQNLISLGYPCGSYGADGEFGSGTQNALKAFQNARGITADGIAGPITFAEIEEALNEKKYASKYSLTQFIRDVQAATGSAVDGIAGPETLRNTVTVGRYINSSHKVVKAIQRRLYVLGYTQVGDADGIAGSMFVAAVKAFQKANGCFSDGIITARNKTWMKLLGMA